MLLKRFHDDALAQTSYLVGCPLSATAAIIDPNRDVQQYIDAADREGLAIRLVTETHMHADFVSGARELAARTGAALALSGEGGEHWQYRFAASSHARLLRHGDVLELGRIRLRVRHTPGHTPEHVTFIVTDEATSPGPLGMFSGDFLFVGDVGRPDLLERAANEAGTMTVLARRLFASLAATRDLPDYLQVWPGHGAGSACGKSLGDLPSTTMGYERLANWAFQIADEDAFVAAVLADQPEPPRYFARMKAVNRDGPTLAPDHSRIPSVGASRIRAALEAGNAVIDARATADFAAGHIPGTLNIPNGTSFATWAGSLLPADRDIIVLADDGERLSGALRKLSLVGLDRVIGYGPSEVRAEWVREIGPLAAINRIQIGEIAGNPGREIVDVRGAAEWRDGHIPGATHLYLGDLTALTADLPRDTPIAVHCQGGTRAAIAASLLQAEGFTNVASVVGGMKAWAAAGLPVETGRDPAATRQKP